MTEINLSKMESVPQDPKDQFFAFAKGLFADLDPHQMRLTPHSKEMERETLAWLPDGRLVQVSSVFGDETQDPDSHNDQYSLAVSRQTPDGIKREALFTIDASAYERREAEEEVDKDDLILMTVTDNDPLSQSVGDELELELKLGEVVEQAQKLPTEFWGMPGAKGLAA